MHWLSWEPLCEPNFYVLRVVSGPRVKLVSCKSALNPPVVCSTDRSKAVVPVLVLLLVALWFILRGDLLYVFPCVILFLCFSVRLVLRWPRFGKRELIIVLLVRLFGLCLFRFVGFLFLLGSGKGCNLWLWHSLDFSFTFFFDFFKSYSEKRFSIIGRNYTNNTIHGATKCLQSTRQKKCFRVLCFLLCDTSRESIWKQVRQWTMTVLLVVTHFFRQNPRKTGCRSWSREE